MEKSQTNATSVTIQYSSSQARNLRKHLKMYSGEKPNKCSQCDYASSHAGHLRRYLRTHSGEKPHKCNQCDYKYSCADVLAGHLKRQWRKAKQMQPMQFCLFPGRTFEDAFKNSQWRKTKQM